MGPSDRPPAIYRAVYSPATVAAFVAVAMATLAVSQARTVHDWMAILHPAWPPWSCWAAAAGYEAGVVAVGLVLVAASGDRRLWLAEVILVAASMAAAVDLAVANGQPWPRAFVAALLPVQYLAVILAGHHLAVTVDKRQRAAARVAATVAVPMAIDRPQLAMDVAGQDDPVVIIGVLRERLGRLPTGDELAAAAGCSARTARRWLAEARAA